MDKLKQLVALTVVAVLGVLAAGWFLLISPKRSEASDIRAEVDSAELANQALVTQISMLKAQAKNLPQQQAKLAAAAAKIPDNPALPALIRALDAASVDAGVELVSVAPAAPAVYTPVGAVASNTVSPTTAAAAVPAASTLKSVQLAISVVGGYFQVEQFLDKVENMTRALKVTTFQLKPGSNPVKLVNGQANNTASEDGKVLQATVNGLVFIAPPLAAVPVGTAVTATGVITTPAGS